MTALGEGGRDSEGNHGVKSLHKVPSRTRQGAEELWPRRYAQLEIGYPSPSSGRARRSALPCPGLPGLLTFPAPLLLAETENTTRRRNLNDMNMRDVFRDHPDHPCVSMTKTSTQLTAF